MSRKTIRKRARELLTQAEAAQLSEDRIGLAYQAETLAIRINDEQLLERCDKLLSMEGGAIKLPKAKPVRSWKENLDLTVGMQRRFLSW